MLVGNLHCMSGFVIVSGGDSAYFPLAKELCASVEAASPVGQVAFGFIDGGLTHIERAWLLERGTQVVRPQLPAVARKAIQERPGLAVALARPWLDTFFPQYRTIIWLDADSWVQRWNAIDLLVGAAETGALAIVPGSGRSWTRQIDVRWLLGGVRGLGQVRSFNFKNAWNARLPLGICRDVGSRAELNVGVFALRRDAPHWSRSREWQARILPYGKPFTADQLAMALMTYVDRLPTELLPASCNYLSPRRVDPVAVTLLESYYPYPPVGIVHLGGEKRMRFDPSVIVPLLGLDDRKYQASLR